MPEHGQDVVPWKQEEFLFILLFYNATVIILPMKRDQKKKTKTGSPRDGDVQLRLGVHAEGHAAHRSRWRLRKRRRCGIGVVGGRQVFRHLVHVYCAVLCRAQNLKFPSQCSLFSCSVTNIQPHACTCFPLLSSSELHVSARSCCCLQHIRSTRTILLICLFAPDAAQPFKFEKESEMGG